MNKKFYKVLLGEPVNQELMLCELFQQTKRKVLKLCKISKIIQTSIPQKDGIYITRIIDGESGHSGFKFHVDPFNFIRKTLQNFALLVCQPIIFQTFDSYPSFFFIQTNYHPEIFPSFILFLFLFYLINDFQTNRNSYNTQTNPCDM